MSMIGSQIPENVFEYISKNAGVIANAFDPENGTLNRADIKGATTGGIQFTDKPSFTDNGEDVDNMPAGMMEMMEVESREILMGGTFVSTTPHTIRDLIAIADIYESGEVVKITPRDELKISDFQDGLWFIVDYGKGGYIAIHILNVLNEDGFSLKSTNKQKGQYAFNFKAHYSMANPETVPYEVYIKKGAAGAGTATGTPHGDAVTA